MRVPVAATMSKRLLRLGSTMALLGAGLALVLQAPAMAVTDPFLQAQVDSITAIGVPGAQINDNGSTATSGVANVSNNQQMNSNMKFRIGSVTKSFTGGVALQLIGNSQLSLDDTVEDYLPGLLSYGDDVTMRMLLQHTSGIPDYWESGPDPLVYSFTNSATVRAQTWTPAQLVARVSGYPHAFNPGAQTSYSSTNFVILGMIIEDITGNSLQTEIQNRFITPLGLTGTSFPLTTTSMPSPSTHGYTLLFDEHLAPEPGTMTDVTNYNPSALWAMGNMISTTNDLNTYMKALIGGQLLPSWLTAEMKETVPFHMPFWPNNKIEMGLGIWGWKLPCGGMVYGHEGEVPGSNTFAFVNEDGTRAVSMNHNLLFLEWSDYFDTVAPAYDAVWCQE